MEAISQAGSAVGILAKDGVFLAAEKKITSKVRVPRVLLRRDGVRSSAPIPDPSLPPSPPPSSCAAPRLHLDREAVPARWPPGLRRRGHDR